MKAVQFHSHVGADGVLKIEVPVGMTDADLDIVVIVSPAGAAAGATDGSWPPNFFEETFGCLAEYPLERPPQGEFETRNALR
jgi:hypothetical protein